MSSAFTHAIAGFAIGALFEHRPELKRLQTIGGVALLGLVAGLLPDADVIPLSLKLIRYEHILGHRGLFHAPAFFLIFAPLLSWLVCLWAKVPVADRRKTLLWLSPMLFLALLSHAILDALTDGGLGVLLYFPFDSERHFFAWQPIAVAPLNLRAFFSEQGMRVLLSELPWAGTFVGLTAVKRLAFRQLAVELEAGSSEL
jgi:inner membrane protein